MPIEGSRETGNKGGGASCCHRQEEGKKKRERAWILAGGGGASAGGRRRTKETSFFQTRCLRCQPDSLKKGSGSCAGECEKKKRGFAGYCGKEEKGGNAAGSQQRGPAPGL